ncbi:TIGR04086 family membrane protein [Nocardioides dongkuii]|uniref:TIGR04086 family membrane protein n=1 Tax=Nocardioides dongkuii TaxID=2760089 RepID=UPI0015FB460F|nr:TIGR04086 family membrane protein [Nocardioides dongkuii]
MTDADGDQAAARDVSSPPTSIPRPDDEQVVFRADPDREVVGASRARGFDLLATIGGALAALGTLVLLSSLLGTIGTIGFQRGVEDDDLSIAGLIGGLVVLALACLVGGWVAARMARRRGPLHGLVAIVWLVVLAALLALLAAVAGDDADVQEQVGLPGWFSSDALGTAALITGLIALALMLLAGWLGGKLGDRHRDDTVQVVETRRRVRNHDGGITAEENR